MGRTPRSVLKAYVENETGSRDYKEVKEILYKLYVDQRLEPHEIVRVLFNGTGKRISTHSVRYWIRRLGIPLRRVRPKLIEKRVSSLGFGSPDEYFLARSNRTLVEMSDELTISLSGVQRAHTNFLIRNGVLTEDESAYAIYTRENTPHRKRRKRRRR